MSHNASVSKLIACGVEDQCSITCTDSLQRPDQLRGSFSLLSNG